MDNLEVREKGGSGIEELDEGERMFSFQRAKLGIENLEPDERILNGLHVL